MGHVLIWPRTLPPSMIHSNGYYSAIEYEYYSVRYHGMKVYAGSVLCTAESEYTKAYVENDLLPNGKPMVYNCPPGATASTIRVSPDPYEWAYVQFAEIEVFTNRAYSVFLTLPDWKDRVVENTLADIQFFSTGCIAKIF